jgi:flavodoxin
MSVAVVYFSLEGNTKYVAESIAMTLDADIIPLIPVKEYPTGQVSKYFWCGKSTTFKEKPKLEAYSFDAQQYDLIILGTPIWAGTFAPPLRTFLRDHPLIGKKVALFACCSGGPAEKCFAQMENEMSDCVVLSKLRLIEPFKNADPKENENIHEFCAKLKKDLVQMSGNTSS